MKVKKIKIIKKTYPRIGSDDPLWDTRVSHKPTRFGLNKKAPFYTCIKLKILHPNRFFPFAVSHSKTFLQTSSLYKHLISPYHTPFPIKTPLKSRTKPKKHHMFFVKPRNHHTLSLTATQAHIPMMPKQLQIPPTDSLKPYKHIYKPRFT